MCADNHVLISQIQLFIRYGLTYGERNGNLANLLINYNLMPECVARTCCLELIHTRRCARDSQSAFLKFDDLSVDTSRGQKMLFMTARAARMPIPAQGGWAVRDYELGIMHSAGTSGRGLGARTMSA